MINRYYSLVCSYTFTLFQLPVNLTPSSTFFALFFYLNKNISLHRLFFYCLFCFFRLPPFQHFRRSNVSLSICPFVCLRFFFVIVGNFATVGFFRPFTFWCLVIRRKSGIINHVFNIILFATIRGNRVGEKLYGKIGIIRKTFKGWHYFLAAVRYWLGSNIFKWKVISGHLRNYTAYT